MTPATKTPTRQLPAREAKNKGNTPVPPTTPRTTGPITRSSRTALDNSATPSTSSSAGNLKRRASSPAPGTPTPNKRTRRQVVQPDINYAESSDDDAPLSRDPDDESLDGDHLVPPSDTKSDDEPLISSISAMKTRKTPKIARPSARNTGRKATITKPKRSNAASKALVKHTPKKASAPPVNPPWSTLPYHVLLRIFEFAAGTPLTEGAGKWLVDASTVCHAFTEPALTALYRQPPLLKLQMAHGLVDLLSKPPGELTFNYRQKIRCLDIDVGVIASKTFKGRHLDFKALLGNAPGLTEVYLWHEKDQAPYREIDKNIRWSYPVNMFLALGIDLRNGARQGDVSLFPSPASGSIPRLEAWLWSGRMLRGIPPARLEDVHGFEAFHGLRKLVLVNFQLPSLSSKKLDDPQIAKADGEYVKALVASISVLPALKHLILECSTAVTGTFLSSLPRTIEHLELINCWEVKAEHMVDYLKSHGNALRHLTLNHNQSLSLAFLPELGKNCPRLETLRMNLSYYQIHAMYDDSEPNYHALLTADQVPSWPASLRHLDLKNLRKWDKPAAEVFINSLLNSAPDLPKLRHLEIKAMLDIPFRERSLLRDKWEAQLKQVFLRKWVDPLPNFTPRPKLQGAIEAAPPETPKASTRRGRKNSAAGPKSPTPPQRRSGRIATLGSGPSSRASSTGRETRAGRPSYAEPDTDEDMDDAEESSDDDKSEKKPAQSQDASATDGAEKEEELFVQGLCNVVDIRFDNQKPVENQFRMEDFLDDSSDDPTDDDWDEDNEPDDDNYAW